MTKQNFESGDEIYTVKYTTDKLITMNFWRFFIKQNNYNAWNTKRYLEKHFKNIQKDFAPEKNMVNYIYHEEFTVIYSTILDEQNLHNNQNMV